MDETTDEDIDSVTSSQSEGSYKGPYFGHAPLRPAKGHLRIGCGNVDNIPIHSKDPKNKRLFQDIINYELDALLIQEAGVNWSLLSRANQWRTRVEEVFFNQKTQSKFAYNTKDTSGNKKQWGGTGIFSRGKLAYYCAGAGTDRAGLGRWTWTRFRGKGGMNLRLVSIYRPCKNKGETSVCAVQKSAMQENNDDRHPRKAFLEDLKTELQTWIDEGDQIIVGGDINESVFHKSVTDLFNSFDMRNLIFDLHDPTDAPKTYFYTSEGRVIDGLWGTPGIQAHRAGYLEPKEFTGNHSLLWVDISYNSALGHEPLKPSPPCARKLQLDFPKVVEKYLNVYEQLVDKHQLLHRQIKLERSILYGVPLTPAQVQEAEAIDALREMCMRKAEKRCRSLKMGAVQFSEATSVPLKQIDFWDTAIKRKFPRPDKQTRRCPSHSTPTPAPPKVSPRLWRRKKKAAGVTEAVGPMTLQEMLDKKQGALDAYHKAKKDHDNLRTTFLKSFPPKIRDRLMRKEQQRKLGRVAKLVTGKLESKSVLKVITQDGELTDKLDMERCLLGVNAAKLRASDSTPFMTAPLVNDFGYDSRSPASEQVLQGTYQPPPDADPYACLLLQHLQLPPPNPDPSTYQVRQFISTEDHIRGWKKAKVNTSAGVSKLHFGMFKAHIKRHKLASLDASMRSVAYTTGYSFNRWKKGLDVQLLKRSQDYRAEKLRTILLLEADFNMNNKVIGSDAMRYGERANLLTSDNYGGRRWFRTVEISLNYQLTCNSVWARRGRAIIISNDAKGCYDRIAHTVVYLALRRLGIPAPALHSMIDTIQTMDHYVRTAFGDSAECYGNDPSQPPPQGILQGNGAGPAGWFAIATVLINTLKHHGFGYSQWTIIKQRAITITCFAFVDDTDLIHSNNDPEVSTPQLIEEAQQALNMWEGLLIATGGALAPEKSYWYLLEVIWKNGRWTFATPTDSPGDLYLHQGQHQIPRRLPHQAAEALGIQARPDGKMKDEKAYIKAKIAKWCDGVRTKRLHKEEAWYSLNATIMKTIEYPLLATTFSQTEIDKLMWPLLKVILPKCGLQRRYPRALLYGPVEQRGCGLKNPFWLQLIAHLQAILRHDHHESPTQTLLQENFELVQWYVGSDQTFWDLSFDQYGHLAPAGWVASTWEHLSSSTLSLKGRDLSLPRLCNQDKHLMDVFIAKYTDTAKTTRLNNCRLYLGVTRLSEITMACGKRIDPSVIAGKPLLTTAPIKNFKTRKPTPDDWVVWKDALRECFMIPQSTSTLLRQPIGSTLLIPQPHLAWTWWRSAAQNELWQYQESQWIRWTFHSATNRYQRYYLPMPTEDPPPQLVRVSVQALPLNMIRVTKTSPIQPPPAVPPAPQSLQAILDALPSEQRWAVKHLTCEDNGAAIAEAILNHTALTVCDGSLKSGLGTSAIIVENSLLPHRHARAVNSVPGPIEEGDSHRCELSGLFGAMTLVQCICTLYNIHSGQITIACDNLQALQVFDIEFIPDVKHRNFDLVTSIYELLQTSPIRWNPHHVKGHQDRYKAWHQLSHEAQLNTYVDSLAKSYWTHLVQHCPDNAIFIPTMHPIQGEGWQLWINNTKVVHPNTNHLYYLLQSDDTHQWWFRNDFIAEELEDIIDFHGLSHSMPSLPRPLQHWCSKTASRNCGIGTTLEHWDFQDDSVCPRCAHPTEDAAHVSQCRGQGADEVFSASMKKLQVFFDDTSTCPDIQDAIVRNLNHWRHLQPLALTESPSTNTAIQEQANIGWQAMLEGLLSKRWKLLQMRYYRQQGKQKSINKWQQRLIRLLLQCGQGQWKHRNEYKHILGRPRHKAFEAKLNQCIIQAFRIGEKHLLPGDKHYIQQSLISVLSKPLRNRKQWLLNVHNARQRFLRKKHHDDTLKLESQLASPVFQWMLTNRAR